MPAGPDGGGRQARSAPVLQGEVLGQATGSGQPGRLGLAGLLHALPMSGTRWATPCSQASAAARQN